MTEYTTDDFLGGLVRLKQEKDGYRATSDAVLLAAAVPARSGQDILDVGCGNGAACLCLAARVPDLSLTGIDIQQDVGHLAVENAALNNQKFRFIHADIGTFLPDLHEKTFHHVMTNPPYFTEDPVRRTPQHALAHKENLPLSKWIEFCLKHVRPKGTFTLIHRAERLPEILALLDGKLGGIIVVPFWPKAGVKPKRVLVQGTLGTRKPFVLHPGFILHNDDNTRTVPIEDIMRRGAPLSF